VPDALNSGGKFWGVVCADDALARCKPQRFQHARNDTRGRTVSSGSVNGNEKNSGTGRPASRNTSRWCSLLAAVFHRLGRVVTQAENARSVRRVTVWRSPSARIARTGLCERPPPAVGRLLGLLEMQRDGTVGPRIVELMATVAADGDIDAQPLAASTKLRI